MTQPLRSISTTKTSLLLRVTGPCAPHRYSHLCSSSTLASLFISGRDHLLCSLVADLRFVILSPNWATTIPLIHIRFSQGIEGILQARGKSKQPCMLQVKPLSSIATLSLRMLEVLIRGLKLIEDLGQVGKHHWLKLHKWDGGGGGSRTPVRK